MIKDTIEANEKVNVSDEKMGILKRYFPACFHDNDFDIARFREYLNDKINVTDEGYELRFIGKNYARLLAALDTTTVIVPDEEHNEKEENKDSQNIYISADNLDALKHLLKSYAGKIQCIYLDPPYNTGSDGFVYRDSFNFTVVDLTERLSVDEDEATRILDLARRGSASHSAWLMFMLPRLELARDLLSKNGIIFISIDDNEQADLRVLCDEIFGEDNFAAQIVVQSNKRGQTYKSIAKTHEYILVYLRSEDSVIHELEKELDSNVMHDNTGDFSERELRNRNPKYGKFNRPNLFYPIYVNPNEVDANGYSPVSITKSLEYPLEVLPLNSVGAESCWRWGKKKFEKNNDADTMVSNVVARKKQNGSFGIYEKYRKGTYKAKTIWYDELTLEDNDDDDEQIWDETGVITEQGSTELRKYGMGDVFDFPKPTYLIKKVLSIGSDENAICLDFFSGSGTLAEAVMSLNSKRGNRKFICVQLPENMDDKLALAPKSEKTKIQRVIDFLDENNYPHSLDYVGIERIKRAADRIKAEHPDCHCDLGFKHYTLKEPTGKSLNDIMTFDQNNNDPFLQDSILNEFGEATLLATWMERDGYGLNAKPEVIDLNGYTAYLMSDHFYLIHSNLTNEAIDAIVTKYETVGGFPLNIVLFGYSFNWSEREGLADNLRKLQSSDKNLQINIDVRY